MSTSRPPSFEHLRVLIAVADTGSFSAAARQLGRTQSAVSYMISGLEGQLGMALFERGRRRPMLTPAGRAVLEDARRIAAGFAGLCARATALSGGLEAELSLAVDVMFPAYGLVRVLEAFASVFPTVALRLRMEALGGVAELVLGRECGLGVAGWFGPAPDVLVRRPIGAVELVSVAAPGHPLARHETPIPVSAVRDHVQLVLSDRSRLTEGRDFGVYALRTWRLGDLGAKHALLLAGLGWGNMPLPMVADDLEASRLIRLKIEDAAQYDYPMSLIHRAETTPGPAARWLADRLATDAV